MSVLEVALTAVLFADIRLLGSDRRNANRIAFHSDEPERAAVWIAERIRSARLGQRLWDGSEREIEEHIARVNFDLGELLAWLRNLRESDITADMSWIPWSIVFPEDIGVSEAYEGPLLADAHLHSGAALNEMQLLRLLMGGSRAAPADPSTLRVCDAGGVEYDLKVLVHGIRHYVRSLTVRGELVGRWGGGCEYWKRIRHLAMGAPVHEADVFELWENYGPCDPDQAIAAVRATVFDDSHPAQVSLASAFMLLTHAMRSRDSETLGAFVDRFELVGGLRDSTLDVPTAQVIQRSCRNIYSTSHVRAAEFRKTLSAKRRPFGEAPNIRKPLANHLEGCALFRLETGRSVNFAMPLSFVRETENGAAATDELISHYRWTDVCAVASAIVAFVTDHPSAAGFIGGVDVVGNELNTSNWPFVVVYREMQRRCSIPVDGFSAHAGEFFRYRLQGLRSIGELVLPDRVVRRIGHGLALAEPARGPAVRPRLTYREIVEDLLWLIGAGIEESGARAWLARLLGETGVVDLVSSADDWVQAWQLRRSWAGLHSVGLVGSDPFSSLDWPPERLMIRELRNSTQGPRRALILLIYRGAGATTYLDRRVSQPMTDDYLVWANTMAPIVSDALVEAMVDHDVIVEACPTSNLRLTGMRGYEEHPLPRLLAQGLRVSLNSDDPLMFGTNVAREARIVRDFFGDVCLDEVATTSVASCCVGLCGDSCDPAAVARFLSVELGHESHLWEALAAGK